ncbi:AbiH family protein [Seonamhaeicola sp.]|uniref:AbiH family protein n=1 Tax=Seonamhaeicola sp. TaxID=1912245 RepID=UPI0026329392|nr:AbiH family protein [Seonamhaeicola sp.]
MAVLNIVGNGFDRSHDLKTSYGDFIRYLVKESINFNQDIRDNLFDVGKVPQEDKDYETIKTKLRDLVNFKQISFKNDFLRNLMDRFFEANWVDIEEYYFILLKNIKNGSWSQLEKLQREFIQVKEYLEKYLFDLSNNSEDEIIDKYLEQFVDVKHKDNLFLNFNYTNTLGKYLPKLKSKIPDFNFKMIHIHGELFKTDNPIVFGYGDENDDYFRIRDYDNDFTLFHKTHIYPLKSHKRNLLAFLNNHSNIELNVFGHSCGISDRVLLRQIFEHNNVRRIKIFYHLNSGENNFQDISSNIFKTLNNNSIIDSKLVPMPECEPMAQAIKA